MLSEGAQRRESVSPLGQGAVEPQRLGQCFATSALLTSGPDHSLWGVLSCAL